MSIGEGKFVRLFGRPEIYLTACAVTKNRDTSFLLEIGKDRLANYFAEPNQFWKRDPNNERALIKVYMKNSGESLTYWDPTVQIIEIPMPFLGHDSSDGWGELQFLIKSPATVKLARHQSFDTRVNRWVEETGLIQPKTDSGTHSYLALRFYYQDHLPPVPGDWHFEPVYVSVRNSEFYRIDATWEGVEIKITATVLEKDLPEIPKHLK